MTTCVEITADFEPVRAPMQRMLAGISATLDVQMAAGGEMIPSAPVYVPVAITTRPPKNGLVPLVANVNGVSDNAKIDSLLVEVEKLSSRVGVVVAEIEKVSVIMKAVGETEPVPVVASVPSASLVSELVDTGIPLHEEIRNEARKTRARYVRYQT
jgi:hypothetical protein